MEKILEQLLKERRKDEVSQLDGIKIVKKIFSELIDREKDVLSRRFGLHGEGKETLEGVGRLHNLTRERVRQIESASLKKLRKISQTQEEISYLKKVVKLLLEEHGGLMREEYLLDVLSVLAMEVDEEENSEVKREIYKSYFNFLLSKILDEDLEYIKNHNSFNSFYKLKDCEVNHFEEMVEEIIEKVKNLKQTFKTQEILDMLKELKSYNKHKDKMEYPDGSDISKIFEKDIFPEEAETINKNKQLYSFLQVIKDLEQNKFGYWGLKDWQEVKPKTINDKIYLVLKNKQKPMHFTEIAEEINKVGFDNKKANPATVHNELILDDRYELVGRGTYSLKA